MAVATLMHPREAVLELVRGKVVEAAAAMEAARKAAEVVSSPSNAAFAGEVRAKALRSAAAASERDALYWKRVEEYLVQHLD